MGSNAYIARGERAGILLMKVGKANDIQRRQKQIGAVIEYFVTCLSESAALRIENDLRGFVIANGGIRHKTTLDWFRFDARIYEMLQTFLQDRSVEADIDSASPDPNRKFPQTKQLSLNEEIEMLRSRYFQLLQEETKRDIEAIKAQTQAILFETEQLRLQLRPDYQEVGELYRQIGRLESKVEILEQKLKDRQK